MIDLTFCTTRFRGFWLRTPLNSDPTLEIILVWLAINRWENFWLLEFSDKLVEIQKTIFKSLICCSYKSAILEAVVRIDSRQNGQSRDFCCAKITETEIGNFAHHNYTIKSDFFGKKSWRFLALLFSVYTPGRPGHQSSHHRLHVRAIHAAHHAWDDVRGCRPTTNLPDGWSGWCHHRRTRRRGKSSNSSQV